MTTRLHWSASASLPLHPYITRGSTAQGPSTNLHTNRSFFFLCVWFILSSFSIIKIISILKSLQSVKRKQKHMHSVIMCSYRLLIFTWLWIPKLWFFLISFFLNLFSSASLFLIGKRGWRREEKGACRKRMQYKMMFESLLEVAFFSLWCQEKSVTAGHCLPFLLLELKMVLKTQ